MSEPVAPPASSGEFWSFGPAEAPGGTYHLLNAIVAPRPVAWVSTWSAAGVANVAPHSYFSVLATVPPILGFSSTGRKDTLRNIEASGEYVINVAGIDLIEQLNLSSADFPPDISEFSWVGLTPLAGELVNAPRVAEAPISMELRLLEVKPIGNAFLVIGEVLRWHLRRSIIRAERIDPRLVRQFGRHSGSQYSRLNEYFNLERPTYRGLLAEQEQG